MTWGFTVGVNVGCGVTKGLVIHEVVAKARDGTLRPTTPRGGFVRPRRLSPTELPPKPKRTKEKKKCSGAEYPSRSQFQLPGAHQLTGTFEGWS